MLFLQKANCLALAWIVCEDQKTNSIQHKLDQLLIEAIDEVFCSFGEPVKNTLYIQLENTLSITKSNLPEKIEDFSSFLYRLFGPQAKLVELKCMKTFYSKIKNELNIGNRTIILDDEDITLLSYVNKFRAIF